MFSGMVQNQGVVVKKRKQSGGQIYFVFQLKKKEKKLAVGESIAVDGVCLTVTTAFAKGFSVDVVPETLQSTTLKNFRLGQYVNLERSLKWGERLSGHFVTGHVDGCGRIRGIEKRGKNRLMVIRPPKKIHRLLGQKGSVAVDGISLTVQALSQRDFTVALIPHTIQETALIHKKTGDFVNLEVDLIMRYLAALPSRKFNVAYLKKQGF